MHPFYINHYFLQKIITYIHIYVLLYIVVYKRKPIFNYELENLSALNKNLYIYTYLCIKKLYFFMIINYSYFFYVYITIYIITQKT